jgi:hypothetical protein
LDLYTQVSGVLTDIYSLEFQIFDATTGTAVQVYPATLGDRQVVDVGTLCPTGGKLGTGHYVAAWTVPDAEPIGTHQVKWYFKLTSGSPEQIFTEEFEVLLVSVFAGSGYAPVQDFRDQGITTAQATDEQLTAIIIRASRFIEKATRRFFEPRAMVVDLDGSGGSHLFLDQPIIAIDSIDEDDSEVQLSPEPEVKVYNRHLTQGLLHPDDRDNPKIEFTSAASTFDTRRSARRRWRPGEQNVRVGGIFGYTDPEPPNPTGKTPDLIRRVCVMLGMRDVFPIGSDEAIAASLAGRVTEERTRDQSVSYSPRRAVGTAASATPWTDDPEINTILDMYRAPPVIRTTGPRW